VHAVALRDEWARRELKIVLRKSADLSKPGQLVLDHLRTAERAEKEARASIARAGVRI
jgi:hypothetical protein